MGILGLLEVAFWNNNNHRTGRAIEIGSYPQFLPRCVARGKRLAPKWLNVTLLSANRLLACTPRTDRFLELGDADHTIPSASIITLLAFDPSSPHDLQSSTSRLPVAAPIP